MKKAKTPRDNIATSKKLVKPRVPYGTPLKSKVPNAKIKRALVAGPKRTGARPKAGKNASALAPPTKATGNRFPEVKSAPIADKPATAPAPPPPEPRKVTNVPTTGPKEPAEPEKKAEPKKAAPKKAQTVNWSKLIPAVQEEIEFNDEEYSAALGVSVSTFKKWLAGKGKPSAKAQKSILEDVAEHTTLKVSKFTE